LLATILVGSANATREIYVPPEIASQIAISTINNFEKDSFHM